MLLPQEIAEQLTPDEFVELNVVVKNLWNLPFGIVAVHRVPGLIVVVELEDMTRHEIVM